MCYRMQVTEDLLESVHDCFILKSYEEVAGLSDHCPIGLTLKL
jgi:exonuclease III